MPAGPTIHFVGHSSFAIDDGRTTLLADPWLEGTAFNDGWSMLSPAVLTPDLRSRVTDIYISHEHPDHFSPRTLKTFTGRSSPTIRIQHTRDGRVAKFCESLGFRVEELPVHKPLLIGPECEVISGPHRHMDSWLMATVNGIKILNINDCSITSRAQAMRLRSVTGPVDVLFTQFSYANWVGNPDEAARRRDYADLMMSYIFHQIEVLEPRYVVPFASFVRFTHEENSYLTDGLPELRAVVNQIARCTASTPVVMYPGDTWTVGDEHDNESALVRYEADLATTASLTASTSQVDIDELSVLAAAQVDRLKAKNHMAAVRLLELARYLPPVHIHLWDLDRTVEFRCNRGLSLSDESPNIEMSSDSLAFCLANDFGAETLYVNGRYRIRKGSEKLFFRHFYPAILNNQGFSFPVGAVEFVLREKLAWRARAVAQAFRARRSRGVTAGR